MKILLFLFAFSFYTFSVWGQTQNKVIINFNAHRNDFARPSEKHFKHSFWLPSLEYLRRKDKRILSFELAKFSRKTLGIVGTTLPIWQPGYPLLAYKDKNTQALLRFQYQRLTKVLVSDKIVSVNPYYGIALTPHYVHTIRTPLVSGLKGKEITSIGITTHASLGMYLQFKRFFINVNTLWGLGQVQVVEENEKDPSLTHEQQYLNYTEFKFLPKDNLFRIGIGMGI